MVDDYRNTILILILFSKWNTVFHMPVTFRMTTFGMGMLEVVWAGWKNMAFFLGIFNLFVNWKFRTKFIINSDFRLNHQ